MWLDVVCGMKVSLPVCAGVFLCLCMLTGISGKAERQETTADPDARPSWDLERLFTTPKTYPCTEYQAEGVTSIYLEGEPFKGKPTRIFALYGVPEVPAGKTVPAMVLVHGGGGSAFADWVRLWTGRGYAAIAMDLNGCIPEGTYNNWQYHQWNGPMGISNPGNKGGLDQIAWPLEDQWAYHAVAAVIRAHAFIRSLPEVDANRTGLTGASWGGYLTCIVAGVDTRFKCAAPVYGCGFLHENTVLTDSIKALGTEGEIWARNWDPSHYLPKAGMPLLWISGTNDFAFPLDSAQKSYRLPTGPRTLCYRIGMAHGHGGPAENPREIEVFVGSILKHEPPLATITDQQQRGNQVTLTYRSKEPIVNAELTFTRDLGKWQDRKWEAIPAVLDPTAQTVTATIPEGAKVYFINLFDDRDCAVSSEHVEIQ